MTKSTSPTPARATAPAWWTPLLVVVCAAATALSVMQLSPPDPSATGDFSLDRAADTVRTLTAERRGTGTEGHAAARRLLASRLGELGYEVEVQRTAMTELETQGPQRIVYVQNVVGRLRGTGGREGAVLLTAHYDSVADGPGAADDASGVASLLEVGRLLATGEPPQRDVVVLFSDGEELGLVGARAFSARHPWAERVVAVLNFEARGSRGPSIMFETGPGSGRLIDLYADVAPAPVANSLSEAVYSLMPNDTDFSVYLGRGLPGLNFAFIEGVARYHHRNDTAQNLSPAALAHQGTTALALSRALCAAPDDLFAGGGGDRIFFNLPALGVVTYSRGWALPLAVLALLAVVAALLLAGRRRRPAAGAIVRGAVAGLATVAATLVTVLLLHKAVSATFGLGSVMLADRGGWYLGWGLAAAGLGWLFWRPFAGAAGRRAPLAAAAAGVVPWCLLALFAALTLPGLSHLFLWPLLAAAVALLVLARADGLGLGAAIALLASAVVWVLVWTPPLVLSPAALGGRAVTVLAVACALSVCLLAPVLALLPRPGGRGMVLPALLAVAGLATVVYVGATAGYDGDRLRPTSVYHLQDADAGEAWAMTLDMPPEPWTAGLVPADAGYRPFPRFFEGTGAELAASASPTLPLPPPRLELTSVEETAGGGRRLTLHLASARGAPRLSVLVRSPQPLAAMSLGDVPIDLSHGIEEGVGVSGDPPRARLRIDGAPQDGWPVIVEQATAAPLSFDVVDWRWDLPPGLADGEPPADLHTRLRSGIFRRVDVGGLADEATQLLTESTATP